MIVEMRSRLQEEMQIQAHIREDIEVKECEDLPFVPFFSNNFVKRYAGRRMVFGIFELFSPLFQIQKKRCEAIIKRRRCQLSRAQAEHR